MMTALYYDDPYLLRSDATITGLCHLSDKTALALDRTIFYPEGGGQPGDRGSIGGHGLLDTQKMPDLSLPSEIAHLVPYTEELKIGERVELLLDWEHRFDYMQQHSGQHIISGAFWHTGGYATVSVHLGQELCSVEFEADNIPEGDLRRAADFANAAIAADLPIRPRWVKMEELEGLPLRRGIKVKGRDSVRLVEIAAFSQGAAGLPFDLVGCGGVHVKGCAEVRLVQHVRLERIRGRVRVYWKIGDRAVRDYQIKAEACMRIGGTLSLPVSELAERVAELRQEHSILRRKNLELKAELFYQQLEVLTARGLGKQGQPPLAHHLPNTDISVLRSVAKKLQKNQKNQGLQGLERAVLVSSEGEATFWLVLDEREEHLDFGLLSRQLGLKGGGKAPVWQGSSSDYSAGDLLEALVKFIQE